MHTLNNPQLFQQACFINNQWIANKDTLTVNNPFTGKQIGTVPMLSASDIDQAITHASTALTLWSTKTAKERAEFLHAWADLIDQHKDDLAHIMTLEQGKPLKEAKGEIGYANSFVRWFAEEGKRVYGDTIPATRANLRHLVLKQPIGVCAAITPWNFPAAMITRKVAPALAAGCTIIVKPASQTPFSALALAYLAKEAGLPQGVLQVVTGKASAIGKQLASDERITKLSFTGSTDTGRTLMTQCSNTLKKLSMELGGNAPFIVFDDANLEQAVDGLIASKYRNAGQTCVCANRIYVQNDIKNDFLALLKDKVSMLNVGNGLDNDTDIGPLINQDALDKTQHLLKDALAKGATLVAGGTPHPTHATCFLPTIIADITDEMCVAHEEIFAPIAPVFAFDDEQEVIKKANNTIYGLAAYFYTNDVGRAWRVSEQLEYGMVAQNTGILSTEVAPFGGIKQSGFGREGSKYGIDEYLITKYWCINIDS